MNEVIIIGGGPAGVSAALYTARAGIKTTIISMEESALVKAHKVDNYYGVNSITGPALFASGIAQAEALGVTIIKEEVVGINFFDNYTVNTVKGAYSAGAIIISTGSPRKVPQINGIDTFDGKGISYCAVCDGFFFRGKTLGVLGNGEYALHEATELMNVATDITLFTDGKELDIEMPPSVKINSSKIVRLSGNIALEEVETEIETVPLNGLFIAQGTAGSADLARKIGAQIDGNKIIVNENMETNVPGLYAAGDCTGGMLQIAKAVYEGAKAGTEVIKFLRKKG